MDLNFKVKVDSYIYWLCFSSLFFIIMSLILPIRFEENDDVVMLLFASGQYTGTPEFRLVFINVVWGIMLKCLYTLTGKIEWYSLLFGLSHIFSLSIILWSVFKGRTKKYVKLLFILFFLILEARFIAFFQFTTTSALLGGAGLILTLQNERKYIKIGLFLLVAATLIRFEAAIMMLILFFPLIVNKFYLEKKIQNIKLYLFAFLVIGVFYGLNRYTYTLNEEWNSYYKYNRLRGGINDNPNAYKINNELLPGLDSNDYDFLLKFFPDYNIIDSDKIQEIFKLIDDVSINKKIQNIIPALKKQIRIIGLVFFITVLISLKNTNKTNWYLYGSFLLFIIILAGVSFAGTLKNRVFFSCLMAIIYSVYYLSQFSQSKKVDLWIAIVLVYFCYILAFRTNNVIQGRERWVKENFKEQKTLFDKYIRMENSGSLIPYNGFFQIEYISPFKVSVEIPSKTLSFGGWLTGIPYNKHKIYSHQDLINNNAIFVSKDEYHNLTVKFINSFKKNYGISVKPSIVKESKRYVIFKLVLNNT